MKIYDYDAKFFEYASGWLALHPNMKPEEAEEHYNEMMSSWLDIPAKWLDGQKPGEYFNRYSDPRDLIKLLEEYDKRDMGMPEPLLARVTQVGEPCLKGLINIALNNEKSEDLRGTAIVLAHQIGGDSVRLMDIELLLDEEGNTDFADMAVETLKLGADSELAAMLSEKYDSVNEFTQDSILEICNEVEPVPEKHFDRVVEKLMTSQRGLAFYACLLGELGDTRAIEPLLKVMQLEDIGYLDYIELRNAVEMLGGEPGEERVFNGDPEYEALKNM